MQQLSPKDRMRLLEFVCSFAWTDLRVSDAERALIRRIAKALALRPDEIGKVESWLRVPPRAEEVDPTEIPHDHRQLFLDAARAVIEVDGVNRAELDALSLFEDLLA